VREEGATDASEHTQPSAVVDFPDRKCGSVETDQGHALLGCQPQPVMPRR
jgi:hypothetical protein